MLCGVKRDPRIVVRVPSALHFSFLAAACVSTICACSVPVPCQQIKSIGSAGPPPKAFSSASREGLFRIDVVVTDAGGGLVTDLHPGDFTLFDNDQPTRIFTLNASTRTEPKADGLPELILVFDDVDLSAQQLARVEEVTGQYLRENGGRLAQPVALYRLTHNGLYSSTTAVTDGNALAMEVEKRKEPRIVWMAGKPLGQAQVSRPSYYGTIDYTQLYNFFSLRALGSIGIDQRSIPGRKTLVWFGNGWPVTGRGNFGFDEVTELSTRLREARITVNMASIWRSPEMESMQPAELPLPLVATQTGGLVLDTTNDLKGDIERCAAEARDFYSLTFDPPHTSQVDEYHHLAVKVSRPGLTARTVAGYYNEPVYFDHPRPNVERVTVAQLEETVRRPARVSDLARRLGDMELTERLSNEKRANLLEFLHKEKEREALTVVADLSEFLAPPPGEEPLDPVPDRNTQLSILKRTFDYLANTVPQLPDFYATRIADAFEEPKPRDEESWKVPPLDQTLHLAYTSRGTVLYRDGAEEVDVAKSNRKQEKGRERELNTRGTFGPILASVLMNAARGESTVNWGRWEWSQQAIFAGPALRVRQSATGQNERIKLAVFHFAVPSQTPIFEVSYCCLPEGDGTRVYRSMTSYHGEFAIDPETGALMRLAIEADLGEDQDPRAPLIRSVLMVEYGQTQIAGKPYICPARSVSVSRGRTLRELHEWGMHFIVYAPFETMLNDFTFSGYHKFGSESRILAGFEEVPDSKSPDSSSSGQSGTPH